MDSISLSVISLFTVIKQLLLPGEANQNQKPAWVHHTLAPLQKICHLKDVMLVGLFVDLLYRQGHSRIASFN